MGKIFNDPLTTAAAKDRVVNHSVILELITANWRTGRAKKNMNDVSSGEIDADIQ